MISTGPFRFLFGCFRTKNPPQVSKKMGSERQALNGAAGPMNCVTPSALAALWFPSHQRAMATSVVYAIQMAGPSVGFLLGLGIKNSHLVELIERLL